MWFHSHLKQQKYISADIIVAFHKQQYFSA